MGFLALVAVLGGIGALMWLSPVGGFAIVTMLVTFALSLRLDLKRLHVERPYFFGDDVFELCDSGVVLMAVFSSLARALGTGAIALFTFPGRLNDDQLKNLTFDTADLETERLVTFGVFAGVVVIGVILGRWINRHTDGLAYRWSLFRMTWLYCLLFALGMFLANPLMKASEPETGDVVRAVQLADDFRNEDECARLSRRLEELDAEDGNWAQNIGRAVLKDRTRAALKRNNCQETTEASLGNVILALTTVDQYVDAVVQAISGNITARVGIGEWLGRVFASLFLSSNLVQGLVISVYVTLILAAGRRRKPALTSRWA